MNFTIKRNIVEELDNFRIKIKLMSKGIRIAIILSAIGIIAIIVCQSDFGITDKSSLCYLMFEVTLFSSSFIILKRIYNYRKVYKDFSESALRDYGNLETYSTISMDDSFFTYESLRKFNKFSWSSFVKCELKNGNLVLMINECYSLSFIIKRNELSEFEFQELYSFVSKNISLPKK